MIKARFLGSCLLLFLVWTGCGKSQEEQIQEHIKNLSSKNLTAAREMHIKKLVSYGKPAVEPLIKSLENSKDSVRRASAAIALGRIGHKDALEPLREVMENDEDAEVRGRAIEALFNIEKEKAIPDLIKMLGDRHSTPRTFAQNSLCETGNEAVDPLIKELNASDANLRRMAEDTLIKLGFKSTESVVVLFRQTDDTKQIISCARILAGIGDKSESVIAAFKEVKGKFPAFEEDEKRKNPIHRQIEGYYNDLLQK